MQRRLVRLTEQTSHIDIEQPNNIMGKSLPSEKELEVGEMETSSTRPERDDKLTAKATPKSEKKNLLRGVPFWKLFQYADILDIILIVIGSLSAIANGFTLPAIIIIQSHVINSFGTLETSGPVLYAATSKVHCHTNCPGHECIKVGVD